MDDHNSNKKRLARDAVPNPRRSTRLPFTAVSRCVTLSGHPRRKQSLKECPPSARMLAAVQDTWWEWWTLDLTWWVFIGMSYLEEATTTSADTEMSSSENESRPRHRKRRDRSREQPREDTFTTGGGGGNGGGVDKRTRGSSSVIAGLQVMAHMLQQIQRDTSRTAAAVTAGGQQPPPTASFSLGGGGNDDDSGFIRGDALMSTWKLQRFSFLMPKLGRPGLLQDQSEVYPSWAPNHCLLPSSTLTEFQEHGYDAFEVALSLVGGRQDNAFARSTDSFLHMPFKRLEEFIAHLHPQDRFLAYPLADVCPVHMYFALDADFEVFPHLRSKEEGCLHRFVHELSTFFRQQYSRPIDTHGMLLLQASSSHKMSWRLHLPGEAFENMHHQLRFVHMLRESLEHQQEVQDGEEEAAADDDDEDDAVECPAATSITPTLCVIGTGQGGGWSHVVDASSYNSSQILQAPYNQKPCQPPLVPRPHRWDQDGRLSVIRPSSSAQRSDQVGLEVLFRAHPLLALPAGLAAARYQLLTAVAASTDEEVLSADAELVRTSVEDSPASAVQAAQGQAARSSSGRQLRLEECMHLQVDAGQCARLESECVCVCSHSHTVFGDDVQICVSLQR